LTSSPTCHVCVQWCPNHPAACSRPPNPSSSPHRTRVHTCVVHPSQYMRAVVVVVAVAVVVVLGILVAEVCVCVCACVRVCVRVCVFCCTRRLRLRARSRCAVLGGGGDGPRRDGHRDTGCHGGHGHPRGSLQAVPGRRCSLGCREGGTAAFFVLCWLRDGVAVGVSACLLFLSMDVACMRSSSLSCCCCCCC
jgi:hypothetical protein